MGKERSVNAPSPKRSLSDINATPLLDVMLVLLITISRRRLDRQHR